jgi:hypothetical protein
MHCAPSTPKGQFDETLGTFTNPFTPDYVFTNNIIWAQNPTEQGCVRATIDDAGHFPSGQFFPGDGTQGAALAAIGNQGDLSASLTARNAGLNDFTSTYRASGHDGRSPINRVRIMERTRSLYNTAVRSVAANNTVVGFNCFGVSAAVQVYLSSDNWATKVAVTAVRDAAIPVYQLATFTSGLSAATAYQGRAMCPGEPQYFNLTTR